jgi:uncharacterized membrane protein (DUF106 family)
MVFLQSLNTVLDPIFNPLLTLPSLWAIIIISFLVATVMTLVYKWMTDQTLMKTLKDDLNAMQKEVREFSHDPTRALDIQKRMMEKNMEYMMHSFKPTFVTFIPVILIFGWLSSNLAYMPLLPNQEFKMTIELTEGTIGQIELNVPPELKIISGKSIDISNGNAVWILKGPEGEYDLTFNYKDRTYVKPIEISSMQEYLPPIKEVNDEYVKRIVTGNEELKPLNLFGWKIGWLGTYIIISIISSMLLRKVLNIH